MAPPFKPNWGRVKVMQMFLTCKVQEHFGAIWYATSTTEVSRDGEVVLKRTSVRVQMKRTHHLTSRGDRNWSHAHA